MCDPWCSEANVLCEIQAMILTLGLSHRKKGIAQAFRQSLQRSLDEKAADEICAAYGIGTAPDPDSKDRHDEDAYLSILSFL